jgi:hypothetical protein
MREHYDFSKATRGAAIDAPGKTRITIMLDNDVLEHFRAKAEAGGLGYQTMINALLRTALDSPQLRADEQPVTAAILREILRDVVREELRTA